MSKNKRKKYLVTVNSEAFACSLVTNPAVEELFVSFSEDKPLIEKFADDSKHMLTGVVAIPNKPIYRRNKDGEEYDIVFSAEAIEKMAMDYMRNYRQNEVTLQHQEETDGVYLVEQWIKHDPYRDKSAVIGLSEDLPVGSWIQTYYVDSNDVWQRIESGELRGLSLECALGLQEFESQIDKNDNNMDNMTNDMKYWTKFKEVLSEVFSSVSMQKQEEDIEPISIEDMAEQTPNEPTVETPAEPTPEPTEATVAVEEPAVETPVEEPTEEPTPQEPTEAPKEDTKHLEELINSMKSEIEALKGLNAELKGKVKTLEKQPSAAPINTNAKPNTNDTYKQWRSQMASYLGY